ncbi:MAG: hypothetical protein AAF310_02430 [Myxococcota bacterium]
MWVKSPSRVAASCVAGRVDTQLTSMQQFANDSLTLQHHAQPRQVCYSKA